MMSVFNVFIAFSIIFAYCSNIEAQAEWSWVGWSSCSRTCGEGVKNRIGQCSVTRSSCQKPPPQYDYCNLGECGYDIGSDWTSCSATCGRGAQSREIRCVLPSELEINDTAELPGCTVPNDANLIPGRSYRECVSSCQIAWSEWGPWGSCLASGKQQRRRLCLVVATQSSGVQRAPDTEALPEDKCHSIHSLSSDTSSEQSRSCDRPSAHEPSPCELLQPGTWESWSECTSTCTTKLGFRSRKRLCNAPTGRNCIGPLEEYDQCRSTQQCPPIYEEGRWEQWAAWEPCSKTCGTGMKRRTRRCQPLRSDAGEQKLLHCNGDTTQLVECESTISCSNETGLTSMEYSLWTSWSTCSKTCGPGTKSRQRHCIVEGNQPASREMCPDQRETEECEVSKCTQWVQGDWSNWATWGQCSVSCGSGLRQRRRHCNWPHGLASFGSEYVKFCQGNMIEAAICNASKPCPCTAMNIASNVCNWYNWESWSTCEIGSCDKVKKRYRVAFCRSSTETPKTTYDTESQSCCSTPKAENCINQRDGLTVIQPRGSMKKFSVYCEGGWIVLEKRQQMVTEFATKTASQYKNGFGNSTTDFFVGLDTISHLTNSQDFWEMRVEFKELNNHNVWINQYNEFKVSSGPAYIISMVPHRANVNHQLFECSSKFGTDTMNNQLGGPFSVSNACTTNHGPFWYSNQLTFCGTVYLHDDPPTYVPCNSCSQVDQCNARRLQYVKITARPVEMVAIFG